jgi:hypothetical protein
VGGELVHHIRQVRRTLRHALPMYKNNRIATRFTISVAEAGIGLGQGSCQLGSTWLSSIWLGMVWLGLICDGLDWIRLCWAGMGRAELGLA